MFYMNVLVLPLLMGGAPAADSAQSGGLGGLMSFLPFVAIIAIFYFLIIRPQNKKQKETQKMLAALKKGDKIVTIGGIHGTIQSVKESTVIVKVDMDCRIEFSRSAISGVESAAKEENKPAELAAGDTAGGAENGQK
jgi:preprotein translocase subunit YajC